MEIKIIENKESFLALKLEWETLQNRTKDVTYYSTFHFLYEWYINIANKENTQLCIVCVYEKKKIIAIAPLMTEERKYFLFKTIVLRFIGRADFLTVLIDEEVKHQAVLKKIFDIINEKLYWNKLELTHIAAHTCLAYFCLKSERYNSFFENLVENPIIRTGSFKDFKEFESIFFRKKIRQYGNKIKREKNAFFNIHAGNSNQILNKISVIHKERNDSNSSRHSLFNNKKKINFLKRIFANEKFVKTFCIETEEQIVSYISTYNYNGVLHCWNMAFDSKFLNYSPGDLIYYEVIKYAFENKNDIKMVDFGAGRYPWKFRMTDNFITTYKLDLNNKNSKKHRLLNWYDKTFKIAKIILK